MYQIVNYFEIQLTKIHAKMLTYKKTGYFLTDWSERMNLLTSELACIYLKDVDFRSAVKYLNELSKK